MAPAPGRAGPAGTGRRRRSPAPAATTDADEQRHRRFQGDHPAQHRQRHAGEAQQAERPSTLGEPAGDVDGEAAAGDRQAGEEHDVGQPLEAVDVVGVASVAARRSSRAEQRSGSGARGRCGPARPRRGAVGGDDDRARPGAAAIAAGEMSAAGHVVSAIEAWRSTTAPPNRSVTAAVAAPSVQRPRAGVVASSAHVTTEARAAVGRHRRGVLAVQRRHPLDAGRGEELGPGGRVERRHRIAARSDALLLVHERAAVSRPSRRRDRRCWRRSW